MIGYHLERGVHLKLDVQAQGGEIILDVDEQRGSHVYHPLNKNYKMCFLKDFLHEIRTEAATGSVL